ncbi:stress response membrane protein YncL [unidentified bacterial endosymbiont]|uniref:stress response membrane protein YncL n=1 Tax=unidentified bacterial endosymbiont TaxID=2355 RepID=UPI00344D05E2
MSKPSDQQSSNWFFIMHQRKSDKGGFTASLAMLTLTKGRLYPLCSECRSRTLCEFSKTQLPRRSHSPDAGLILNRSLKPKVHSMNVSSRTVVILNILSATGLVLILADKFQWF